VSSSNGAWLKKDGAHIPVVFEGTAYQVPGTLPPAQTHDIDPNAVPLGTVTVTADGPGVYTSPPVIAPTGGFVTWVWEVKKSSQPEWVRDYLAERLAGRVRHHVETTSVRWPVTVTSLMREYNVHPGGRALSMSSPSRGSRRTTVISPATGTGTPTSMSSITPSTAPSPPTRNSPTISTSPRAPVLAELMTPARNGVYKLGYTDEDKIVPTEPGFYVLVTTFAGDDRVQPYASSPADVLERFYVPPTGTEVPVIVW
jgi:hypothetical protein